VPGLTCTRFTAASGHANSVTVVSSAGKEATITLLADGDFVGEEALATVAGCVLASATPLRLSGLKIGRDEMLCAMHEEAGLSRTVPEVSAKRGALRIQADLVDQLFNSSEKRLAVFCC